MATRSESPERKPTLGINDIKQVSQIIDFTGYRRGPESELKENQWYSKYYCK